MMNFTLLRHNQEAVIERLHQQKYYDNLFVATANELDKLIAFRDDLKLFSLWEIVRLEGCITQNLQLGKMLVKVARRAATDPRRRRGLLWRIRDGVACRPRSVR